MFSLAYSFRALLSHLFYDTNFLAKQCGFPRRTYAVKIYTNTSLFWALLPENVKGTQRGVGGSLILEIVSQGV